MTLLLAAVVDLSIILAAGLCATVLMRRRSAAMRHWILAAAVVAGAAAPALELMMPPWPVPLGAAFGIAPADVTSTLRFTTDAAPVAAGDESTAAPAPSPVSWTAILIGGWMAGALVGLIGLATGLVRLARVKARCVPILAGPWRQTADRLSATLQLPRVQILQSDNPSLLVTWGLLTPKIILPAGAAEWSEPRRRIVLAHEMAHIGRRDWLLHLGAEALRAVYWVNPLAWLACRRLRQESEYACDDAVLSGGVEAAEYASHLLEVARHAIGHRGAWVSAPAIAHPSTLERRIAAMLTEKRNRDPLTRRACFAAAAAIVAVALPITALAVAGTSEHVPAGHDTFLVPQVEPAAGAERRSIVPARARAPEATAAAPAQQNPATITGTMLDPSGGALPGVRLTLADQFGTIFNAVTDGSGRFRFGGLQPGRYELLATLPGFATVGNVMALEAGASVERSIVLPLGSLEETIIVTCGTPAAGISPPAPQIGIDRRVDVASPEAPRPVNRFVASRTLNVDAPQDARPAVVPVRIGGQIAAPRQIRRANPVCPRTVLPSGDTIVVLTARIGVDGYLNDLREVPPAAGAAAPAPEFVDAALDAVRQWGYTPTRLNNVPVEAAVQITVRFGR